MCKHLLRYVQTPITLCANTYYVLVNAFLTQIKTKRINDMHFENEENQKFDLSNKLWIFKIILIGVKMLYTYNVSSFIGNYFALLKECALCIHALKICLLFLLKIVTNIQTRL